jgi:hypothetical protein
MPKTRTRKTPRKERRRVVKVQFLARPTRKPKERDHADPYGYIDDLVAGPHDDLKDAKIAVAWMLDVKPDRDGHLCLGRCKKATDLDREFREFDFVVLLNSSAWKSLKNKQRLALVDHELCHAAVATDKNGDPIRDERDRLCWRIRRHDIEEFTGVVKRHGCYLNDVAELVRVAQEQPLFAGDGDDAAKE